MGGSESKSTVKQLSEAISNIAMSTVQECETTASQDQSIVVNNSGWKLFGSYKVSQATDITSQCFSDTQKQAQLQNGIINAIKNASTASGVSVLSAFGKNSSEAVTDITNRVVNNITMSNIQKNYSAIKQKQSATFNNSGVIGFETADLSQGAKVFAAATLQAVDNAGIFNQISSKLDQQSTAVSTNPLDIFGLGGLFAGLGSVAMYALVFLVIVIGAVLAGWAVAAAYGSQPAAQAAPYV